MEKRRSALALELFLLSGRFLLLVFASSSSSSALSALASTAVVGLAGLLLLRLQLSYPCR
jgi:hypothetical protein